MSPHRLGDANHPRNNEINMAPTMKVVSLNLGLPRTVQWKNRAISTAIFKAPVSDRVALRPLNFDGDRQVDLAVHGGQSKAVYAYPAEHYAYWRRELPDMALPWGMFGENLTTEGLEEDAHRLVTGLALARRRSSSLSHECHASSLGYGHQKRCRRVAP
jgi:hypothetical protein